MFSSKKETSDNNSNVRDIGSGINSLGGGTTIEGNIKTESDFRLDGSLEGNLDCNGKLILGPKGRITGNIKCINAVIEGTIKGIIHVKELLQVKESAEIYGEIYTDKLMVQSGAVFNVKCEMGGQIIAPKAIPNTKTA
jgi:cytoskeletal protein CcmA (bactofilin family)